MKGKRMFARPRRRERKPLRKQIWSVHGCRFCPFLDEFPYSGGQPSNTCRLTSLKCSMGPRAQREEADRQVHMIKDMLKTETPGSWMWSPEFCPLRQDYPAGITVMYEALEFRETMRPPRIKAEDHYASVATGREEARKREAARRKEREEAKQRKEARKKEREEEKQRKEAESIQKEEARRQKVAQRREAQDPKKKAPKH